MLYPIIDVGSNTVKLSVLDEEKLFSAAPVFFKAVPLCLKTKAKDGVLSPEAGKELLDLIKEFAAISSRLTPNPPLAFATASLRSLSNRDEICNLIRSNAGVNLQIISGEEEAYYSFLGALGNQNNSAGITVDLGGGSTEILSFQKKSVLNSVSLPIGCLTLYERYFSGQTPDMEECRKAIRNLLSRAPALPGSSILISGGSAKALLRYKFILENNAGALLSRRQMEKILWHYDHGTEKKKAQIQNILKDRFRLIPPAAAVFTEILAHYKKNQVIVCRSGVREGRLKAYLMEKAAHTTHQP